MKQREREAERKEGEADVEREKEGGRENKCGNTGNESGHGPPILETDDRSIVCDTACSHSMRRGQQRNATTTKFIFQH